MLVPDWVKKKIIQKSPVEDNNESDYKETKGKLKSNESILIEELQKPKFSGKIIPKTSFTSNSFDNSQKVKIGMKYQDPEKICKYVKKLSGFRDFINYQQITPEAILMVMINNYYS